MGGYASAMQRRHTLLATVLVTILAVIATIATAIGILDARGLEPAALEPPALSQDAAPAATEPGPQSYSDDLVVDTNEFTMIAVDNSPLPSGRFAQATVLAPGTDVPYADMASACAEAQLAAAGPAVDGGICAVYHSQEAYDDMNVIREMLEQGTATNLLGNMCYTVVAWAERSGPGGSLDLRTDGAGWQGYECPALPGEDGV